MQTLEMITKKAAQIRYKTLDISYIYTVLQLVMVNNTQWNK